VSAAGFPGADRRRARRDLLATVAVVSLGGVIGSLLRYQAGLIWPTPAGAFPTTILLVNLLGCLVIGVFLTVVSEIRTPHRLVRSFFATGVLGGFTTFSTYSLDIVSLIRVGQPARALEYLLATAIGTLFAVAVGVLATRRFFAAWGR
jgi:CrcB protein